MWPHVCPRSGVPRHAPPPAPARPSSRRATSGASFGLLPPSISHEGYSAKPMHSYWDDFFALRGLKDAVDLARALGRPKRRPLVVLRDEFRRDLYASIQLAMIAARHRLHPRRRRPRRLRRHVDDHRGLAGRGVRPLPQRGARWTDVRALLAEFVARRDWHEAVGCVHAVRASHRRAPSCGSVSASARMSSRLVLHGPAAGRVDQWAEVVWRRSEERRSSSATCRTRGSARTTSARCSTSSRTTRESTRARPRRGGARSTGWRAPGRVRCASCRTRYGPAQLHDARAGEDARAIQRHLVSSGGVCVRPLRRSRSAAPAS